MAKTTTKKEEVEKSKDNKHDKIAELTDTLKRVQAEFENYKKRCDAENRKFMDYTNAKLVEKLLPIIDSFQLALKSAKDNKEFTKGVELIYSQLVSALENEGLRPINALNQKFDPYKHEALLQEEKDGEENVVLEELQKGYMFKDCVLRHAKVRVSKKPKNKEEKKDDNPQEHAKRKDN